MSKKNLQAPLVQSTYSWDSELQDHNAWLRHCKFIIIRQTVKYVQVIIANSNFDEQVHATDSSSTCALNVQLGFWTLGPQYMAQTMQVHHYQTNYENKHRSSQPIPLLLNKLCYRFRNFMVKEKKNLGQNPQLLVQSSSRRFGKVPTQLLDSASECHHQTVKTPVGHQSNLHPRSTIIKHKYRDTRSSKMTEVSFHQYNRV